MNTYLRTWALDDISISRSGDGRTVTAYAAMFDAPYEVRDQHGHYMEQIERSAFNRTLSHGGASRVACLFNHGLTVHGTPDGKLSVPLGTPLEIKPDGRGLLTVTRYNRGEVADLVLESIRNGDIRSQSFRGRIFRSSPDRLPRQRGGALPTVVRHELGLSDYGPTPVPVNGAAEIVAVRSQVLQLAGELEHLDDDEREELLDELARHLRGRHNQGSHGNRFHTPGDRGSGLRRKGVERLTGSRKDKSDGDNGDDMPDAEKPAERQPREFSNRDVLDVLGGKNATVAEHLQTLKDNGATHEQAVKILRDLHIRVDEDPNAGRDGAYTSNSHERADFRPSHGYDTAGGILQNRVKDDERAAAEAKRRQALKDATPNAIARLLGEDGQPPLAKSKPVRAVVEAMREQGWTLSDANQWGQYGWSSPDGTKHLRMSTGGVDGKGAKLYDERHNPISGVKALEHVTGQPRPAKPAASPRTASPTVDAPKPAEAAGPAAVASVPTPTAAASGPMAGMSVEDQQRIRNAVADRGPEIFASPMVGGSRSDVARYLAEGRLTSEALGGRHDWRTVSAAVRQVIDENPSLIERNPQQAKADAEARTARVDAIVDKAQEALKSKDMARVAELLDEAYAIDPDHRLPGVGGNRSLGYRLSEIRDRIRARLSTPAARSLSANPLDDLLLPNEVFEEEHTATPADAGPGAEDSHQQVHSGRLSIRRNRIRAELISLGVIKP